MDDYLSEYGLSILGDFFTINSNRNKLHNVKQFSWDFDEPIDDLEPNTEIIFFTPWACFNQPVDNLPASVKIIIFGEAFNQSIDFLPESVEFIFFTSNSKFNKPINNLPSSLRYLIFNNSMIRCFQTYDYDIVNLPASLMYIDIKSYIPINENKIRLNKSILQINVSANWFPNHTIYMSKIPNDCIYLCVSGQIRIVTNTQKNICILNTNDLTTKKYLGYIEKSDILYVQCDENVLLCNV